MHLRESWWIVLHPCDPERQHHCVVEGMSHPIKVTFTDAEWALLQERFPHEKPAAYCRRIVMGEYRRHAKKRPKDASLTPRHVRGRGTAVPVTARGSRGESDGG